MNLAFLVFLGNTDGWKIVFPENCFTVLRKFIQNTCDKLIFSQYNIFLRYKYFFFSICFPIAFQVSPKKSIKSGKIQSVFWLKMFPCLVVYSLRTCCNVFQHFFKNQNKQFYCQIFGLCYFL